MKKLTNLFLALTLACGAFLPAFAGDGDDDGRPKPLLGEPRIEPQKWIEKKGQETWIEQDLKKEESDGRPKPLLGEPRIEQQEWEEKKPSREETVECSRTVSKSDIMRTVAKLEDLLELNEKLGLGLDNELIKKTIEHLLEVARVNEETLKESIKKAGCQ